MAAGEYDLNVFINCPFDAEYAPIFEAIVFSVHYAGFRPKCAREKLDSSQIRVQKIADLIAASRYSIHDLSRTQLDSSSHLPRFNMPFELGMDVGCKTFNERHSGKSFLIFESKKYDFQKYISDIAGQDVQYHGDDPKQAVKQVRNWLRSESGDPTIPGGTAIFESYERFRISLPEICSTLRLDVSELTFVDFSQITASWLDKQRGAG
jgi:hypothetical protein